MYKKHRISKTNIFLLCLLYLLMCVFSISALAGKNSSFKSNISWSTKTIDVSLNKGTTKVINISFKSNIKLKNVKFWLVPNLRKYTIVAPAKIKQVSAGDTNN